MGRLRRIDTSPKFLPVDLFRQLLPGTFESEVSVKAYVSNAIVKRSGRVMRSHLYPGHARNKTPCP
jgi:hypothetical protein